MLKVIGFVNKTNKHIMGKRISHNTRSGESTMKIPCLECSIIILVIIYTTDKNRDF